MKYEISLPGLFQPRLLCVAPVLETWKSYGTPLPIGIRSARCDKSSAPLAVRRFPELDHTPAGSRSADSEFPAGFEFGLQLLLGLQKKAVAGNPDRSIPEGGLS